MSSMSAKRAELLAKVASSIKRLGYHIYVISGGDIPRYAYTIGLYERLGLELVFAGGYYFSVNQVQSIIRTAAAELSKEKCATGFDCVDFGRFKFSPADQSWSKLMLLAAFDYYKVDHIRAVQVCPAQQFWTIDVPDMTQNWESSLDPVWKKLESVNLEERKILLRAATNLAALRGGTITEAARWEEDDWELFAGNGPDVLPEDVRVVPLSLLLAVDPTLSEIANLEVGEARWREARDTEWHMWN